MSSPTIWCGRTASATRRAGTLPVWPRSGARKIAHVGGGAGVLDQVADAHDLADDRDVGLSAGP